MWTAPGDDFESGKCSGYKFLISKNVDDLIDAVGGSPSVLFRLTDRADEAGSRQAYSFEITGYDYGADYSMAVVAVDDVGNESNRSNIALVRVPEPDVIDPEEEKEIDWIVIGIAVGAILALLVLLCCCLYLYFFLVRRKHRRRRAKNAKAAAAAAAAAKSKSIGVSSDLHSQHNSSDSGSYESDPKNSSSNQLVPKISTISSNYKFQPAGVGGLDKPDANGGTSFGNNLTPTYWSASQLLKGHEERQNRDRDRDPVNNNPTGGDNPGYEFNEHDYPNTYGGTGGFYDSGTHGSMADTYGQGHYYDYDYNGYPPPTHPDTQRYSTAESSYGGGGGGGVLAATEYHPAAAYPQPTEAAAGTTSSDTESTVIRNPSVTARMPKHSASSDQSSSGIGANPSLHGSVLSLNAAAANRPGSTQPKQTRNITQV